MYALFSRASKYIVIDKQMHVYHFHPQENCSISSGQEWELLPKIKIVRLTERVLTCIKNYSKYCSFVVKANV
jgi:hypothetical protein